jgi:hypothetical protein
VSIWLILVGLPMLGLSATACLRRWWLWCVLAFGPPFVAFVAALISDPCDRSGGDCDLGLASLLFSVVLGFLWFVGSLVGAIFVGRRNRRRQRAE